MFLREDRPRAEPGGQPVHPVVIACRYRKLDRAGLAVRKTVAAACTQLGRDFAALPAGLAPADRAEAENRAAEALVAKVRTLDPEALHHDQPVEQWLGDWERIVAARRQALREGKRFTTPSAGGMPVNIRMFELIRSGLEQCDVPRQLLVPEPGSV